MVENAKVTMPTLRIIGPTTGMTPKACEVRVSLAESMPLGAITQLTRTRPVMAQTTTVSQKVPVEETRAWRTGLRVWAAAAAMGAEPRPDSLENSPRAIPKRQAVMMVEPTNPPPAAWGEKAEVTMTRMVSPRYSKLMHRITMQPMI